MSDLKSEFESYLAQLEASGWQSRHLLESGASQRAAEDLAALAPGPGSDVVREWFGLVGGMRPGPTLGAMWLIPLFVPLSPQDSVAAYKSLMAAGIWEAHWWPFLEDQAGWFHAIDVSSPKGAVIFAQIDMGLTPLVFDSLSEMFSTYRHAVLRGLIAFSETGEMRADEQAIAELAGELNPAVAWWA